MVCIRYTSSSNMFYIRQKPRTEERYCVTTDDTIIIGCEGAPFDEAIISFTFIIFIVITTDFYGYFQFGLIDFI